MLLPMSFKRHSSHFLNGALQGGWAWILLETGSHPSASSRPVYSGALATFEWLLHLCGPPTQSLPCTVCPRTGVFIPSLLKLSMRSYHCEWEQGQFLHRCVQTPKWLLDVFRSPARHRRAKGTHGLESARCPGPRQSLPHESGVACRIWTLQV